MEIREKIKKLLALSESPNENEAKAALLKAKELMAKNKLSEADFDKKDTKLVSLSCDVTWTTDSGNSWMVDLSNLIANEYLCNAAWDTPHATRTHKLVVTGLEEDANLCKVMVEYIVGFMMGAVKVLQKKYRHSNPKVLSDSYAKGFIIGLEMAFEDQRDEHPEWELVVVKPEEVREYESKLHNKSVKTRKVDFSPLAYMKGQNDGREFTAKKVIEMC